MELSGPQRTEAPEHGPVGDCLRAPEPSKGRNPNVVSKISEANGSIVCFTSHLLPSYSVENCSGAPATAVGSLAAAKAAICMEGMHGRHLRLDAFPIVAGLDGRPHAGEGTRLYPLVRVPCRTGFLWLG